MTRLRLTRLEDRAVPAVVTWDGGPDAGGTSANDLWTTATNWVGDAAPQPGDDLVFPTGARQLSATNDFPVDTAFNSVALNAAGFTLAGNRVILTAGTVANVPAGLPSAIFLALGGTGGLTKTGPGDLAPRGANTYTGPTTVADGRVVLVVPTALGATGPGNDTILNGGGLVVGIRNLDIAEAINVTAAAANGGPQIAMTADFGSTISGPVTTAADLTILAASVSTLTFTAGIAEVGGPRRLTLDGDGNGAVVFAPGSTVAITGVTEGSADVAYNGTGPNGVVRPLGIAAGIGTVGSLQVGLGGSVTPGPGVGGPGVPFSGVGTLTAASLTLGSVAADDAGTVELDLTAAGVDRINVAGQVLLQGNLALDIADDFAPTPGTRYRLIDHTGTGGNGPGFERLFGGTGFAPGEGSVVAIVRGVALLLTYRGGDGNDVELVAVTFAATQRFAVGAGAGGVPQVNVYDGEGVLIRSFLAYEASFRGGVRVASADVTGDGVIDTITAPNFGGGPVVRIWDGATGAMVRQFLAYDANFRGGVSLAVANIFDTTGLPQIVTGAGPGGGPHVRVFDATTAAVRNEFFAYDARFLGGISVAATQSTGSSPGFVVTGPGPGGGPHVRTFDGANGLPGPAFLAYDAAFTGGVNVAAAFVGTAIRIVTAPASGGGPVVRVYDLELTIFGLPLTLNQEFLAYESTFRGGVNLGLLLVAPDRSRAILTGPSAGGGPLVLQYEVQGVSRTRTLAFFAFDPAFQGGVFVG